MTGPGGTAWRACALMALVLVVMASTAGCVLLPGGDRGKDGGAGTVIVRDDYGRDVPVPSDVQRVISIAPSCTEILFAIGAGPRMVAVDNNSNYPAEAIKLPKVSGYMWTDWERILVLDPDLVFAADINKAEKDLYEQRNITIFFLAPFSMAAISENIRLAGRIMGLDDGAEAVADDFDARMANVTNKVNASGGDGPSVYLELDGSWGYWTYGPGTFGDEIIAKSGGRNIAGKQGEKYPQLTAEYIISADPDIIIYQTGQWVTTKPSDIKAREGWDGMTACKQDKIYGIDGDLISRPGPRMVEGLEMVAAYLYPGLFP